MARETVGKIATDLQAKKPETRDPIELEREMNKDYEKNIYECIARAKKDPTVEKDFYIQVETKKERLLTNVIRNYFFYRNSCPTPNYDQILYRYTSSDEKIELIWVIPSRDTCHMMRENALNIANEEKELLSYVLDFSDGTLFKRAKKLNGEKLDTPELEKDA